MAVGWKSVRTFRTRQASDPAGAVRTFGAILEVDDPLLFGPEEAPVHLEAPAGCAHGKVVAVSRRGDAVCWQVSACGTRARVAACGNGTAAAAALLAGPKGVARLRLGATVHIDARADGKAITQTWRRVPCSIRAHGEDALCEGALNDYLVLKTPGDPAAFPAEAALARWERTFPARDPLLLRIALVEAGMDPRVRFLTCDGREHPSAPLTGLAVLALVADRLGWPLGSRLVRTRAGRIELPRVRLSEGGADVEFAPLVVELDEAAQPARA